MSELVLGLMSGTSLDGVDAALVQIHGETSVRLEGWRTDPYDSDERAAVLDVIAHGSARDVALLHRRLGIRFARAAAALLDQLGVEVDRLAVVASHGQTVWHEPGQATLQLGCAATIAETLGVRVVSDFRSRDVAAGGQGAPLVPMADVMVFGHPTRGRALLNIGGMANVTWVPRRGEVSGVIAFDTGPGVAVIDAVVRRVAPGSAFDEGGRRAAAGHASVGVVNDLLELPYFAAAPPKSTGRERFGEAYAQQLIQMVGDANPAASGDDCVATALELTARAIAQQIERWLPQDGGRDLVVSGGGARNPTLLARIHAHLSAWPLVSFDDEFFDGDAKEAVAFAYLGWRTVHGLPGNVSGATGAGGARILGSITPG
ncbi:MAG: anhydro-N-acetylmuramic acid kinase [Gemmatimonadota bacterium]|nr:anhydro-N-acetylmuramic acid kinase [Gemmatimonadota bacterium]